MEGHAVGVNVGAKVSATDGSMEGATDGTIDGLTEGAEDGAMEGFDVGTLVDSHTNVAMLHWRLGPHPVLSEQALPMKPFVHILRTPSAGDEPEQ